MCGISGFVYHDRERSAAPEVVKRMCDTLVHRGPDDDGFYVKGNVALGMRRLSIIDLVTGHQPISNEDGKVWIVFNGEIYNFAELRDDLRAKGHEFATNTDTEAIVHAYEEYGVDCVKRLNGMFAYAIWDEREQRLVLARDRVGIKPLYYYLDDKILVFGSELKALLENPNVPRDLDHEALDAFLTFEYIPAPLSIFKGVRKLPPGHTLVLKNGEARIEQYWEVTQGHTSADEAELSESLYELIKDAVRMRLVSDVPLGAFLSGGVDSSAIVCAMSELMDRPVQTFSIGFDDPSYNELAYARKVADHFGTDHHEEVIRPNVVDLVDGLVGYLDEPMADVSIFPTYLVSKLARRDVTVVLSGDGGDELFAGYDWYLAEKYARYYGMLPGPIRRSLLPKVMSLIPPSSQKKGAVNKLKRFVEGAALPDSLKHFRWNVYLTEDSKRSLYTRDLRDTLNGTDTYSRFVAHLDRFGDSDSLWRQQYADIKTFLVDDILVKVDRMSMAHSLEARTPFLDHRVVEFAASLPKEMRMRGSTQKYLLKKAVESRLPEGITTRSKEGFSIPMKNWLRDELRPMMEEVLSPQRIREEGLFDSARIESLKSQHVSGSANNAHQLWPLMMFQIWRDKYLSVGSKV